jgi:hypothetical protein
MKTIALTSALGVLFAVALQATPAQAASRTWVASFGGGTTCSRSSPCADFQTAHNATDENGEINCVDSGSFHGGTLFISKSITIDCTGTLAAITTAFLAVAINFNEAGKTVTLRGLTINGRGVAIIGIDFIRGAVLHIDNCRIFGFRGGGAGFGKGIRFTPADAGVTSKLYITDSIITDNGLASSGGGIEVTPASGAIGYVALDGVQVDNNTHGISVVGAGGGATAIVQVRDSVVTGSAGNGLWATTTSGLAAFVVDRTSIVTNAGSGILADGASALVHIGSATVVGNGAGFSTMSGGQILSYQNNQASGNSTEGAATGPLTLR